MKKRNVKYIIIITLLIVSSIFAIVIIANSSNIIKKNSSKKLSDVYSEIPLNSTASPSEIPESVNMSYNVIRKVEDGFETTLSFTSVSCIKEIYISDINQTIQNTSETEHTSMQYTFNAQRDITYTIKILTANSREYEKTLSIAEFLNNNSAPSTPTIHIWPEESSLKYKVGRNLTITAINSIDPDGDSFTYEWSGRTSETSTYPVGSHTIKARAIDVYGNASSWGSISFTVENVALANISFDEAPGNTNFNMRGNNTKTTYSDKGYTTVFYVGSDSTTTEIKNCSGSLNGVDFKTTITPIYDGNYAQISYVITNTNSTAQTIGIATHADIMINSNDSATITNMSGNKGFTMTDGSYNYKVYLRDLEYVTDVDTYWFGKYGDRTSNLWNSSNISELTNTDSGMAFSWKNRTIPANSTQTYSYVMGLE